MDVVETIRKNIGLQKTDSHYLLAFLGSMLGHKEGVPCVACGKMAPRRNVWNTVNIAAESYALLDGTAFMRGLMGQAREPGEEKPTQRNLILRNGFCPTCLKRIASRLPNKLKIKVQAEPKPKKPLKPMNAKSADIAVLYLKQHHVIFDEERFRTLWQRSMKIGNI